MSNKSFISRLTNNFRETEEPENTLKERAPQFTTVIGGETMKLIYRGLSYELLPLVVETVEGKVGGQFRGKNWRFHNLKKPPVLQPPVNLTYRGVNYANRPTVTSGLFPERIYHLS